MIDWNQIDTVLLDMDGTLLDLRFDNHFWLEYVPQRYAEKRGLDFETARSELLERYKSREGTLEWYCVDHWSQELELDILLLKQEVDHLIAVHPHVIDFLDQLMCAGKRRVLVTNAHQKTLAFKMERTRLAGFFDRVISSHDIGLPKEDPAFWDKLQTVEAFDKQCTLFVDDSPNVLDSAKQYGIRWLLAVLRPDSQAPPKTAGDYPAIHDFSEIMSGLNDFCYAFPEQS